MYNNYKQYGKEGDVEFENYLQKTLVYWNKYFLGKQKIVAKTMVKKKKKKNKGSIPIWFLSSFFSVWPISIITL